MKRSVATRLTWLVALVGAGFWTFTGRDGAPTMMAIAGVLSVLLFWMAGPEPAEKDLL